MESPAGSAGEVLRERSGLRLPAGDLPVWVDVDLPLLTAAEGRRLLLQVAAEIEPGAALRVGMVQGNRYEAGRLWVNGALTWPEQDLEFVAHGAAEPTRSKLRVALASGVVGLAVGSVSDEGHARLLCW